ncbi:MAG: hypothetical protein KY434_10545 [Actinobacteria bacterium]|nr:hypothetical protein [Actinomycetota bacterium]
MTNQQDAGQGSQGKPWYKNKAVLIPAGAYGLLKLRGKARARAERRRRRVVFKRLRRRERTQQFRQRRRGRRRG